MARNILREVFGEKSPYVEQLRKVSFMAPWLPDVQKNVTKLQQQSGITRLRQTVSAALAELDRYDAQWHFLHPNVRESSRQRFADGHVGDAIEAGFKEVSRRIRSHYQAATGKDLDGKDLIMQAFSPDFIRFSDLATLDGKNMQEGYKLLFAGAFVGIRNPAAHKDAKYTIDRAFQVFSLLSLMHGLLDEAGLPP